MRAAVKMARHVAAVVLVVVATLFGAFMALKTYTQTQELSVGRVQISVEPGHKGALDLYVPLVDWGVRFEDAIRLPVRLHVDLRTVDRGAVAKIANGGNLDLQDVRGEAREAIKSYLLNLIAITLLSALALGTLVAFAIRHRQRPAAQIQGRRGRADDRADRSGAGNPAAAARERSATRSTTRSDRTSRGRCRRSRPRRPPPSSSTRSSTRSSSASRDW